MNWVEITWSMSAAGCLTLAVVHLLVWVRARDSWMNLLFGFAALAVAFISGFELALMHSQTTAQFGTIQRWMHVPFWVLLVSLVWFLRLHLRAGRPWLAWSTCGLRTLALILNFVFHPNLNFREITRLQQFPLWGETVSVPIGITNPWTLIGQLSSLLFLIYVVDASITSWRRGERRRALVMGGTMTFGILAAPGQAALLVWGILPMPYFLSLIFLSLILVMGYELSSDLLRSARLSRELRASEERMSLAATAAGLGMWEWNLVTDEIWATDKSRTRSGVGGIERVDFSRFLQSLHPDDRGLVSRSLAKAMNGDGDYECEYRVLVPDGQARSIVVAGRIEFDARHKPVRMRGVSMDITSRKQAEQDVQQKRDELAHLSRVTMLGELSGSLAHELNQPLMAILSNAQAAQRFLAQDPVDLDELRQILKDIVADDRRAGEVIHRLRMLLKKGEVQQQPLDANELIQEVLKLLQSDLANRQVHVHTELAAELPDVHGDRVQLQQVLINLITNGCNAMTDDILEERKLVVRTEFIASEGIRVSVSDRGCGIPAENLPRIFEPFFTTRPQGMGLGLSVCRTIIGAHHGRLWAENNADRGATLLFTVPAAKREGEGAVISNQ